MFGATREKLADGIESIDGAGPYRGQVENRVATEDLVQPRPGAFVDQVGIERRKFMQRDPIGGGDGFAHRAVDPASTFISSPVT
jgi:hypothetical protein